MSRETIAPFAVLEQPKPVDENPAELRALRDVASRLEAQTREVTRHLNQLHNVLARVFPEIGTGFDTTFGVITMGARQPAAPGSARVSTCLRTRIRPMNRKTRHTLGAFTPALLLAPLAALDDADNAPFRTAEVPSIGQEQKWNTQTLEMTEDIA